MVDSCREKESTVTDVTASWCTSCGALSPGIICPYCGEANLAAPSRETGMHNGPVPENLSRKAVARRVSRLHDELRKLETDFRRMVRQGRREQLPYALVAYSIPVGWLAYFIHGLVKALRNPYESIGVYLIVGVFCIPPVVICLQAMLESRKYWKAILEEARRDIRAKKAEVATATETLEATRQSPES